jgi:prevent-host-death family protein
MEKRIPAAYANREFYRLLQGVKKGHCYVVTSHGTPIAKIVPVEEGARFAARARTVLLTRLKTQTPIEIGARTRDELYDR